MRWPRGADGVLAVAVFIATMLVTQDPTGELGLRPPGEVPLAEVLLGAVASAALYWRRSKPLVVVATTVAVAAVSAVLGYADVSGIAVLAVYSVGRYVEDDTSSYLGVSVVAALIVAVGLMNGYSTPEIVSGLFAALLVYFVGMRIRLHRMRDVQLRKEREADARRIATEERARIARELHDVVAHHVSLMTVQAGAAKTVAADDPEAAQTAMKAVERTGRSALGELRGLLDVLRPDAAAGHSGPQPGVSDLPHLVDQLTAAGMDISLNIADIDIELPSRVDLFAYRIVQEALTNVLKHAGPGARSTATVSLDDGAVVIDVSDDGVGVDGHPGTGHGLIGMRERARLLGGSFEMAPRPGGGFSVVARLPIRSEPS